MKEQLERMFFLYPGKLILLREKSVSKYLSSFYLLNGRVLKFASFVVKKYVLTIKINVNLRLCKHRFVR